MSLPSFLSRLHHTKTYFFPISCGDILLEVNGTSTWGMTHTALVRLLKELRGRITLTIVSWPEACSRTALHVGGAYHIDPALGGGAYTTDLIMTTKMVYFRIRDFLERQGLWYRLPSGSRKWHMDLIQVLGAQTLNLKAGLTPWLRPPRSTFITLRNEEELSQLPFCQGIKMMCAHERNIVSLEMEGGAFNLY